VRAERAYSSHNSNGLKSPKAEVSFRVEKMKLSKDKTELRYNDFLLLRGIPAAAFDYRLGNRSALEWVIDQYRVSTDARTGIVNDPNREDDPTTSSASSARSLRYRWRHSRSLRGCLPSTCLRSRCILGRPFRPLDSSLALTQGDITPTDQDVRRGPRSALGWDMAGPLALESVADG
jgi:hypothetical protein